MSGPALEQLHAHRSIHDGTLAEAKNLTQLLEQLYAEKRIKHSQEVADALLEHWETRALAHAQAEEEGFYPERVKQKPELAETVSMLKRDHDLMRILVDEIKTMMSQEGASEEVLVRFKALLLINRIHSRDEERRLL
ncbi:hemerythrin superfamily protein [Caldalkalibacillus uzonensis]|uniref:Hemerythrin superfamily protein n=1 Tax=Caldalkalibacillus uzonensis TaxID=353224 RepID=A0ABU0CSG5_9BACI|nr:hemerythrin domain-containing protein [Caldalkalibacillus uzonensis]MDQ0339087.1 hemerythrin superfamily protein [Caldalkalibacillus uzonensis]